MIHTAIVDPVTFFVEGIFTQGQDPIDSKLSIKVKGFLGRW